MAEDKFGDKEFGDFMKKEYNGQDPIIIIIEAIRCKMLAVSDIYKKSLDTYVTLPEGDPLKNDLRDHILRMMEHTQQTMDQFNYALISDDEDDEGEDEGEVPGE